MAPFKPQIEESRNPSAARGIGIAAGLTAVLLFMLVAGTAKYSNPNRADFFITYSGGLIVRKGDASKLYDLNEQRRVQERLFKRKGWLFDPYPPFHALLFAPLTWLGYRDAYLTWGAFNVLLWLLFFFLLQRQTTTFREPFRDLLLCSMYYPLWIALMQGQLSLLLLVSLTLTYVYLKRHQEYTSGLFLGLGLIKFQAVLSFALVYLLNRRWKFILGFASAGCLLVLLSFVIVGPTGVLSYVNLILDILRHPNNPIYADARPWNMLTIGAFLSEALGQGVTRFWTKGLAMIFSGALILLTAWRWRVETRLGNRAAFEPLFASTLTVSLIATPYLLVHDLTPMMLAVVLVVNSPQWARHSRANDSKNHDRDALCHNFRIPIGAASRSSCSRASPGPLRSVLACPCEYRSNFPHSGAFGGPKGGVSAWWSPNDMNPCREGTLARLRRFSKR